MRFRLAVNEPNWPLLTGGRCSEVVVKAGLTVHTFFYYRKMIEHTMFTVIRIILN